MTSNQQPPNLLYPVANGIASSNPFVVFFSGRDPTTQDTNYPVQKWWFNETSNEFFFLKGYSSNAGILTANWVSFSAPALSPVLSLSDDVNVKAFPDVDGNIQLVSSQIVNSSYTNVINTIAGPSQINIQIQQSGSSPTANTTKNGVCHFFDTDFDVDPATGFVSLKAIATNDLHWPRYIVGDITNGANYSTWASAVAAAPSGETIGIQPGQYFESFTTNKSLNFIGLSPGYQAVALFGTVTLTDASESGTVTFGNMTLAGTGGNNAVNVTSIDTDVYFYGCFLGGGPPILNGVQPGQDFILRNCIIQGQLIDNCNMTANLINCFSTGETWNISSALYIRNTYINNPLSFSGGSGGEVLNSKLGVQFAPFLNQVAVTLAGTSTMIVSQCEISTGTSSSIVIGAGCSAIVTNNLIQSSNTNVFTGGGTINTGGNVCSMSTGNNVTTINNLTSI